MRVCVGKCEALCHHLHADVKGLVLLDEEEGTIERALLNCDLFWNLPKHYTFGTYTQAYVNIFDC